MPRRRLSARSAFVATPISLRHSIWTVGTEQGDRHLLLRAGCDGSAAHGVPDDLPQTAWKPLNRSAKYQVKTKPEGKRRAAVKQQIVEQARLRRHSAGRRVDCRGGAYRPVACKHTYRLVILRKNLQVSEPRQQRLFDDYRYFLYITDDWDSTPEEIVFDANDRCQQEECAGAAQCRSGLDGLLDNLLSNNAYMLITLLCPEP